MKKIANLIFITLAIGAGFIIWSKLSKKESGMYETKVWSIVQEQVPKSELLVLEERVVESMREYWKASPPWWEVPFGNWPGEASVRIEAPGSVHWVVPLKQEWGIQVTGDTIVISPPDVMIQAIDIDTKGVQVIYEKTAARWNEYEMESALRARMRDQIKSNANTRVLKVREKSEVSIIEFTKDYIIPNLPENQRALPVKVKWQQKLP